MRFPSSRSLVPWPLSLGVVYIGTADLEGDCSCCMFQGTEPHPEFRTFMFWLKWFINRLTIAHDREATFCRQAEKVAQHAC